ncbi:putative nucleotide binding protein [Corchorus olitorius]|uniref:Nucleotide binding protein n=1 Tax=Corchorus olitorius TaxID=93759 RepID=A0A1R3JN65_9ROSI|nr:putative nucleotide binding protein [Corchorus olitorius]
MFLYGFNLQTKPMMFLQWPQASLPSQLAFKISVHVAIVEFSQVESSMQQVADHSDGGVKVFQLIDPLELKNWQLQMFPVLRSAQSCTLSVVGSQAVFPPECNRCKGTLDVLYKVACQVKLEVMA